MCLGVGLLQSKTLWNFQEKYVVYLSYFTHVIISTADCILRNI